MAYNGWSPDDEKEYDEMLPKRLKTPKDKGETPFFDRWNKGRTCFWSCSRRKYLSN